MKFVPVGLEKDTHFFGQKKGTMLKAEWFAFLTTGQGSFPL